MDSEKAGTGTFYLTVVLVVLTVVLVFLGLAVWLYPNPKLPTLPGGVLMKAFFGICILIVLAGQVVVALLIRGRLKSRVAELEGELASSNKPQPATATLPKTTEPEKPQLIAGARPKLTFDIDENESSASVKRVGSHVSLITADLKVRCEKEADSTMVVRAFHLSLNRLETDGKMTVIPYQKERSVIWEYSNGKLVPFNEGWTIDKARTEYRHYSLVIEITPQAQAELSSDHFLQLTMDAIGQDEVPKAIYVKDWSEDNSPISLKRFEVFSPGARHEISKLKEKLRSYETTNAELGRQSTEAKGAYKAQKRELQEAEKRIDELRNEKIGVEKALQIAESKVSDWLWLTSGAEKQKPVISAHVKVIEVSLGDMILTGLDPTVRFGIKVLNNSLLYVSIAHEVEDHVKGKIRFAGHEGIALRGSKIVLYTTKDIAPGKEGTLTIEQRLIDNEARIIDDGKGWPDARFNLSELEIKIVGGKLTPDIAATSLDLRNATVSAFTVNLLERGQRIRAMAEVRGSAQQLHEALRVTERPMPKEVFERWEAASLEFLKQVYEEKALARVWAEVTDQSPIPTTAASQQGWLNARIVRMGAFLAELTGEYISRKTLNP